MLSRSLRRLEKELELIKRDHTSIEVAIVDDSDEVK